MLSILPFDLMSPRALSVLLLGLIVLVSYNDELTRKSSLVPALPVGAQGCSPGTIPSANATFGCGGSSRNSVQGGKLTVGSF
jgi:hypothetical protein